MRNSIPIRFYFPAIVWRTFANFHVFSSLFLQSVCNVPFKITPMQFGEVGNFPFLPLFPDFINLLASKGKDRGEEEMSDCHKNIEMESNVETILIIWLCASCLALGLSKYLLPTLCTRLQTHFKWTCWIGMNTKYTIWANDFNSIIWNYNSSILERYTCMRTRCPDYVFTTLRIKFNTARCLSIDDIVSVVSG